jgi:hypothetical protein
MKFPLRTAAAALALSLSSIATAAITANPDGSYTIDGNTAAGTSFTINFDGYAPNNPPIPGLTSSLTLTFQGLSGNNYLFDFALANTSSAPIDDSGVTAFGFNATPNIVLGLSSITSTWFDAIASGNVPGGTDLEFCVKNGQTNNCAGSQGGPNLGETADGSLVLGYNSLFDSITLEDFLVRYQRIDSVALGLDDGSAIGTPTGGVPEPATWAMMLMGFGAVGYTMRRRRKTIMPQVA